MTRRRGVAALGAILVAAILAGCGGSATAPPSASESPVTPSPDGAVVGAHAPPAPSTNESCNGVPVTASLAPAGALPAPGQMPPRSYMAQIYRRGLRVGVDQNSELWGYRDPSTGQLQGFDIDMVDQVAAAIFGPDWPAHIHLIIVANANRVSAVTSGLVDLVAETMTITCDRKKDVDFSAEYYDAYQTVLVPNGSPIKSLANLAGRKVCASDGSTSLQHLAYYAPKATLVSVANQTDCLVMLQQGQVDAISTDDTILEGLAKQDPNVHIVSGIKRGMLSDEPYGMAISKLHPDFTSFVNAVLQQEMSDGEWARIWKANLSGVLGPTPPQPPPARYGGA